MAYTPDPTDASNPLDTVDSSTAAAEFRALKLYIANMLAGLISATNAAFSGYVTIASYLTVTGKLTLGNVIDEKVGTEIAAAATLDLDTVNGNALHITGSGVSITAVTLGAGKRRMVIFDAANTLVYNATTHNLPGGVDITTVAGDRALYWSDGTTVYCMIYTGAASGIPAITAGANYINVPMYNSTTRTFGQNLDFTDAAMTEQFNSVILQAGTYRISFTLLIVTYTVYGQIYVNGVAVGTLRSVTNSTGTWTEDIPVNVGDTVQIYCYRTNGTGYLREIKFGVSAANTLRNPPVMLYPGAR